MADLNRVVAGIRCIEVLALLSDYLDGDVSQEVKERIEAHLRGCDQCERFGGQMSSIVKSLREQLKEPEALDEGVAKRLQERLSRELGII
ncbi:MAG: zf-HC2 domain-containing protein [Gemmatimonadetes bacterium]|nr:zf-HC2 domain-containing protein [Gemmatimonadota bacterium]NNM04969.1 zf-HC2 domain-containing protein [Gemmatimonadota bacterium]